MPPRRLFPPPAFFGGSAVLHGEVVDTESSAPVADARIFLRGAEDGPGGDDLPEVFLTGSDGTFRIGGLRPQRFLLDVEAPGYLTRLGRLAAALDTAPRREQSWPAHLDRRTTWDPRWNADRADWEILDLAFPEVRAQGVTEVVIGLCRGRRLHGRVRNPAGQPVSEAVVLVERQFLHGFGLFDCGFREVREFRPNRPSTTDTDGRFEVTIHPALRATVRVSAPAFPAHVREIDPLTHDGPLEIALSPATTIAGRILDADGHACQGATLHLFPLRTGAPISEAMSDAEGRFAFDAAAPPFVLVGRSGPGYCVAADDPRVAMSAVELSGATAQVELRLGPSPLVRGRVLDAGGAPVSHVGVRQLRVVFTSAGELHFDDFRVAGDQTVREHRDGGLAAALTDGMFGATTDDYGHFQLAAQLPQQGQVYLAVSGDTSARCTRVTNADGSTTSTSAPPPSPGQSYRGWVSTEGQVTLALSFDGGSGCGGPAPSDDPQPASPPIAAWIEHLATAPTEARVRLMTDLSHASWPGPGNPPLGESRRPDLVPVFVAALGNDEPEVRRLGAWALCYLNRTEAFHPLLAALDSPHRTVRDTAIYGLEWLGRRSEHREPAIAALRRVLANPTEAFRVQLCAAASLVELDALDDPTPFVRALRGAADHDTRAAQALAKLGRRDAVELLIERMRYSEEGYHLDEALKALTGYDGDERYSTWRAWLDAHRDALPPQVPVDEVPSDADGYYQRGVLRWGRGDFDAAFDDFGHAVELDPRHTRSWINRGTFRSWKRSDHAGALLDFARAAEANPADPKVWVFRADVLVAMGDVAGAIASASRGIELDPRDPVAWFERAKYQRMADALEAALADAKQALDKGGPAWEDRAGAEAFLRAIRTELKRRKSERSG